MNSLTDVKIICPDHGSFEQAPSSHINTESGCTGCAKYGFDMSSPAYIYLLKYTGREGEVLKIGITKHLHVRIKQLENSLKLKGKGAFDTIQLIDSRKFNLGKRAKDLEDYLIEDKVDMVIHCAAFCKINKTITEPSIGFRNAKDTFSVLEFCRKNNIKKIIVRLSYHL